MVKFLPKSLKKVQNGIKDSIIKKSERMLLRQHRGFFGLKIISLTYKRLLNKQYINEGILNGDI